jgi:hypothetical protein
MTLLRVAHWILLAIIALHCTYGVAQAQEGLGPFMPNDGGTITTVWANADGPDSESWIRFAKVGTSTFDINYSSSRGTVAVRRVRVSDRMTAQALVLGYSTQMPLVIENTTVLGTSAAVLEELRSTGQASAALIYTSTLSSMQGKFTLVDENVKMPIDVGGEVIEVPAVHATGQFQDGRKSAAGDFYFLNNKNNPVLLQYSVQFTGEKTPRSERIVRVDPGASQRSAMERPSRRCATIPLMASISTSTRPTYRTPRPNCLTKFRLLWTTIHCGRSRLPATPIRSGTIPIT